MTEAPPEPDPDEDDPREAPDPPAAPEIVLAAMEEAFAGEEGLPAGFVQRCADHANLLLDWNQRVNLTAITEPREVAVKHYLDCWRAARMLPLLGRRVVDLGSGAGFPGVPMALAEPNASVTLCESRGRKVRFLEASVEALGLRNAKAVEARAEDHLSDEGVDLVVARAVSSVRETVRLLRKVRHRFSELALMKGASWSREMRAAEREAERLGFHFDTVIEYELPDDLGKRALLLYRAPGGAGA